MILRAEPPTYAADVRHHPFTVLDRQARFVILMWLTGGAGDEDIAKVAPFSVEPP